MTGVELLMALGVTHDVAVAAVARWVDSPLGGHDAVLACLGKDVANNDIEAICPGCGSWWSRSGLPRTGLRTAWWHVQTLCWACGPHWNVRPARAPELETVQLRLDLGIL